MQVCTKATKMKMSAAVASGSNFIVVSSFMYPGPHGPPSALSVWVCVLNGVHTCQQCTDLEDLSGPWAHSGTNKKRAAGMQSGCINKAVAMHVRLLAQEQPVGVAGVAACRHSSQWAGQTNLRMCALTRNSSHPHRHAAAVEACGLDLVDMNNTGNRKSSGCKMHKQQGKCTKCRKNRAGQRRPSGGGKGLIKPGSLVLPTRADPQQPEDQRQVVRLQRRAQSLAAGSRGLELVPRRGRAPGQRPVAIWRPGTPNGTPASRAPSLRAVAAPSRCARWPAAAR